MGGPSSIVNKTPTIKNSFQLIAMTGRQARMMKISKLKSIFLFMN